MDSPLSDLDNLSNESEAEFSSVVTTEGDVKLNKPVMNVATRWNSTFDMIVRGEQLKVPMTLLCSENPVMKKFQLSETEWNDIGILKKLLSKFEYATKFSSRTMEVTISGYLPIFNWLPFSLCEFICSENDRLASAATTANSKLMKYKPSLDPTSFGYSYIPFVTVILNPSLKLNYFTEHGYHAWEIKKIKSAFISVYQEKYSTTVMDSNDSRVQDDKFLVHMHKRSKLGKEVSEITKYLNFPLAAPEVDILDWWKCHGNEFGSVGQMAKDYLAIPSSSVSNERDFSSAVDLVTPCRCSLQSPTISKCMCLKMWWK